MTVPADKTMSDVPDAAEILAELRADLNDLTAAFIFSANGLTHMRNSMAAAPVVPDNPDPMIHMGIFVIGSSSESKLFAQWRMSEARQQVKPDGPVQTRLGQQWIVFLFSLWEHEYRPRLAAAHGRAVDDEKYPLLGDLRRLRNDVVHHRGIATNANTGGCEILHWFQAGETIRLNLFLLDDFLSAVPWQDMADGV